MLFHSKSQSEVAKLLGLSQSSFQKSLSSGNFYSYKIAHEAISSAIEELRVGYI
jgi:predicted transcriptional regulator